MTTARKTKIETVEINLPAHWAAYLINNDCDDLSVRELRELEAVLKEFGVSVGECADVDLDDSWYGGFMADCMDNTFHGDIATYTFHKRSK